MSPSAGMNENRQCALRHEIVQEYMYAPAHHGHDANSCLILNRFIVDDLAGVNRNDTPWVVVNGHRPIYTTSSSGGSLASVTTVARDLRVSLEDIFYQYEVSYSVARVDMSLSAQDCKDARDAHVCWCMHMRNRLCMHHPYSFDHSAASCFRCHGRAMLGGAACSRLPIECIGLKFLTIHLLRYSML